MPKRVNKKLIWIIVVILAVLMGAVYLSANWNEQTPPSQTEGDEIDSITTNVKAFGDKLKTVSLLAPQSALKDEIRRNYTAYVTPDLLSKWVSDPTLAPGRQTSSPWPDRIEIISINQIDENHYVINAEVVEMTSEEVEKGGDVGQYPVKITVEKQNDRWLISQYEVIKTNSDKTTI